MFTLASYAVAAAPETFAVARQARAGSRDNVVERREQLILIVVNVASTKATVAFLRVFDCGGHCDFLLLFRLFVIVANAA